MGVAVHESRDDAAAAGVEPLVPRSAGALDAATRSPSITTAASHQPERTLAK